MSGDKAYDKVKLHTHTHTVLNDNLFIYVRLVWYLVKEKSRANGFEALCSSTSRNTSSC